MYKSQEEESQDKETESSLISILNLQLKEVCNSKRLLHCSYLPSPHQAQDHNQLVEAELLQLRTQACQLYQSSSQNKGFVQLEELVTDNEAKLEKETKLKKEETVEKNALEEKLDTSYREIRKYQDTLQQSQEQLEVAQGMIEDTQVCQHCSL